MRFIFHALSRGVLYSFSPLCSFVISFPRLSLSMSSLLFLTLSCFLTFFISLYLSPFRRFFYIISFLLNRLNSSTIKYLLLFSKKHFPLPPPKPLLQSLFKNFLLFLLHFIFPISSPQQSAPNNKSINV